MERLLSQIPTLIITAFFGLLGVAVGWGWIRSEVKHLKEDQKVSKQKIDELQKDKLNVQFKFDCGEFREKCQDNVRGQLDEIKSAINTNRDIVLVKLDEVKEFMGYVKGKIEDYNGVHK